MFQEKPEMDFIISKKIYFFEIKIVFVYVSNHCILQKNFVNIINILFKTILWIHRSYNILIMTDFWLRDSFRIKIYNIVFIHFIKLFASKIFGNFQTYVLPSRNKKNKYNCVRIKRLFLISDWINLNLIKIIFGKLFNPCKYILFIIRIENMQIFLYFNF